MLFRLLLLKSAKNAAVAGIGVAVQQRQRALGRACEEAAAAHGVVEDDEDVAYYPSCAASVGATVVAAPSAGQPLGEQ